MRYLFSLLLLTVVGTASVQAQNDLGEVLKAESARLAVIQKVRPTVVAIFTGDRKNGGSGVLISDDGYALTNFHVVQPTGPIMQCGLADGLLYDAVLVGLDKVGDVALIKLLPKKAGDKFPFAVMGDSDRVREGDWSMAMGNPFLLANDFTPSISFGLVSGVHRYQYPSGTFLEYTDCIQIDTVINPGNSGGPLFSMEGELIGINGRGSFDKRGRLNSGVGYAISINQIKNFLGHLKGGLDTDHASLGAVISTQTDQTGFARMEVSSILEDSDVARRGLDLDDELVSFAGRPISSVNHFKNVLGLYPRGWRMPMEYRRDQTKKEILVRLMGVQKKVLEDGILKNSVPKPVMIPGLPDMSKNPAMKFYERKAGFANYYFNKLEKDRLLAGFARLGDFKNLGGTWIIDGKIRLKKLRADINQSTATVQIQEEQEGKAGRPLVKLTIDAFPYFLEPLEVPKDPQVLKEPATSGGLLAALFLYQQFLLHGEKNFNEFFYAGHEPIYPPAEEEKTSTWQRRLMCEVLQTRLGPYQAKWFFDLKDHKLAALEVRIQDNEDPCEVYFSDYRPVEGRLLPHRLQVLHGNGTYGTLTFTQFNLAKK